MTIPTDKNSQFIEALLEERDALYRETAKLKSALEELSDAKALQDTIASLNEEINALKSTLEALRRRLWGKSSEKFISPDPLQRRLEFEGMDILPQEQEVAEQAAEEIKNHQAVVVEKPKKKPVRKALPENLPRIEEHIYPQGVDMASGNWVELSPEVTEVLEHKPAEFYVRRIIRHVYVLKNGSDDTKSTILTGTMPSLPLAKSYAGAGLLAELVINKYVNHLPFHRQIQMMTRLGVTIPASTINDWFMETADLLRPLYYKLKESVLATDYIQVDETTIPIIDNEKHKTVKSYLWLVRSVMENTLFFHYDKGSRAQKVAIELLRDFQGALQTDGYEVYSIYENKQGVLPLGCWAHARRKFSEALKEDQVRASYALEQIAMLYDVERRADIEQLTYEQRAQLRSKLAYPIMRTFEKWIVKEYEKVLPKGRIGKALSYTYKIYHRLSRYHLDGRYNIDNNLAENAIRPIAIGRKNYLFCGNHDAAENAAIFYSLLGCCKAADVDFRDWLMHVLNHIHDYDNDYTLDLAELLPSNWGKKNNPPNK